MFCNSKNHTQIDICPITISLRQYEILHWYDIYLNLKSVKLNTKQIKSNCYAM